MKCPVQVGIIYQAQSDNYHKRRTGSVPSRDGSHRGATRFGTHLRVAQPLRGCFARPEVAASESLLTGFPWKNMASLLPNGCDINDDPWW